MDVMLKRVSCRGSARNRLSIALGVALFAGAPISESATIEVTTPDDAGTTSTCTLRQAIAAMNAKVVSASSACANSGGSFGTNDTIIFSSTVTSVGLADQPNNELLITDYALTIQGTGMGGVTVSRVTGATNPFRIFHDQGTDLYLTGLTVTNGVTTATNAKGGAIFLDVGFGDVTLKECMVSSNSTHGTGASGGAIAAGTSFNDATVRLVNSIVSGNSTTGNNAPAGAIYASHQVYMDNSTVKDNSTSGRTSPGGAIATIDVVLNSSDISDNSTTGDYSPGGAIFGSPTVGGIEGHNSTLSGNSTSGYKSPGGAADVTYAQTLSYFLISDNSTSGDQSSGGAVYTKSFFIANSVITGNAAVGDNSNGGAIHARSTNSIDSTIQTSTVSDNRATGIGGNGGGIWALTGRIIESTISGNIAAQGGSGLHVDACSNSSPLLTFYNSTVAFNATSAAGGSGIYVSSSDCSAFTGGSQQTSGSAKLTSTLLADTTAADVPSADIAVGSGFALMMNTDHDLIQRPSTDPSIAIDNVPSSPALIVQDPKLIALADNGCGVKSGASGSALCVPTHAITCAPPRNAGSNPNNYTDDERGTGYPRERATNFATDIGAYQVEPAGDDIFCDGFEQ